MATTTTAKKTAEAKDERVELYIPRGSQNDDPNYFVGVNGVSYLLPRGKTSMVPKAVYDEVMRARRAEEALYQKMDEMAEQGK